MPIKANKENNKNIYCYFNPTTANDAIRVPNIYEELNHTRKNALKNPLFSLHAH